MAVNASRLRCGQYARAAAVLVCAIAATAQVRPADVRAQLERSNDLPWLEHIAASVDFARDAVNSARIGGPKALRVAAFARLGAIGTAESLAAVGRIEQSMAAASLTPPTVALDVW